MLVSVHNVIQNSLSTVRLPHMDVHLQVRASKMLHAIVLAFGGRKKNALFWCPILGALLNICLHFV